MLAWGGLATAGWGASAALAPAGLDGLLPAVGSALFASGVGLTARRFGHVGLQWLTVTAVGVGWAELAAVLEWAPSQALSFTPLAAGSLILVVALWARWGHLSRTWATAWGVLAFVALISGWLFGLGDPVAPVSNPIPAIGLVMFAVGCQIGARPLAYPLHYGAVGFAGWAWVTLLAGLGLHREGAVTATSLAFAALAIAVAEVARSRWGSPIRSEASGVVVEAARAWIVLGGIGVVAATGFSVGLDRTPAWLAVSVGLLVLAVALGRGARPLSWPVLRQLGSVVLVGAVVAFGYNLELSPPTMAAFTIVLAVTATSAALWLTRSRPVAPWRDPLAVLAVMSTIAAVAYGVGALPDRGPIIAVLVGLGAELVATGIIFERPVIVSLGPPVLLAAWLGVAVEAAQGSALWYTVPLALTILAEVDVLRWNQRLGGQPTSSLEIVALEYGAIGLLASVVLIDMFTSSAAYAGVGFALAAVLFVWAAASRVKRRAVASWVFATVTGVLAIFAAAATAAPPSASFWITAAGTGFAVMLSMALIEAYRSKSGSVMLRLDELMEGWE